MAERPRVTLAELDQSWSLADLADAHGALDLVEDSMARDRLEAEIDRQAR